MLVPTAAGTRPSSCPAPPRPAAGTAPQLVRPTPTLGRHRRGGRCRARLLRPLGAASKQPPPPPPAPSSRPARDRVIEFGKHRGQMLGTLPPSYLRWVAAELDYGDTAPWAALARDVLADPVYVDRVEWEHAHRFLRGDTDYDYAYDDGDGPLQEMAERFRWDLSDEEGWGRLDLRLLGTSYGGRIPRKGAPRQSAGRSGSSGAKKGAPLFDDGADSDDGAWGKRDERRERVRARREKQVRTAKMGMLGVNVNAGVAADGVLRSSPRKQAQIRTAKKEILGLGSGSGLGSRAGEMLDEKRASGKGSQGTNPFPGRQAFLDKVRKLNGDDS
ncbi:hypothetical protein U9M48_006057 [Paspalum notatum var. saurae]|uniref:Uncharacterized protein n=1 Tax=Paspalum notatum var. saurae TaxID=547442 RepID=A0AAQ3PN78_PASNO